MRWYVMRGTETAGPIGADLIAEYLKSGKLKAGTYVRDEHGGGWMPIEQSPFSGFVRSGVARAPSFVVSAIKRRNPWAVLTVVLASATVAVGFWVLRGNHLKECEAAEKVVRAKLAANDPAGARGARSAAWSACEDTVRLAALDRDTVATEAKLATVAPSTFPTAISVLKGRFEKLGVTFKRFSLIDGTPRLFGQTADTMTLVELIGHDDILERAAFMFVLSKVAVEATTRNTGAILVFMRDTGWAGGQTWAINAIAKAPVENTHNGVTYKVMPIGDAGVFMLSATPSDP